MFIRNENFYTFRRIYPVVTILIGIHILFFIWMNFLPGGHFVRAFGIGYNLLVAEGEYWRLFTPIFLHIGLGHLVFNSFSLIIFGPALEQMLGRFKFILVYISAGVIANVATFYVGGLHYPQHLGASGAIFGLLGLYTYMVIYRKDLIDQANAQIVIIILAIGLIMTFVYPHINKTAHIFGLIAGACFGPLILTNVKPYVRQLLFRSQKEKSFNPNRSFQAKKERKQFSTIIWIAFFVLVVIGLLARLL